MASASPNPSCSTLLNNPFTSSSAFYYHKLLSRTSFPFSLTPTITPHKTISIICCSAGVSITPKGVPFTSRFRPDEPRKGCDVLVEALEREGVTTLFAYPGGTTLEIHQALTRCPTIRNILPRHEQGGIFAAEGYARATGFPGVCMATSGPGATNLISGLADAMLDSIPIVAITGQLINPLVG
ncbi:Acetolactate synthase 1, chloroplastic [Capsicum chinense]|nr:Acetolactate synthase 1, chloroplastic [Capsicum chinense]